MNQVIVELDHRTMQRLNAIAPAKARRRSEFIREAIRRALDAVAEAEMEAAYRLQPQADEDLDLSETWEPAPKRKKARAR